MGLLALLALLRCALDPVDNLYYHEPLLLALIGWDALSPGRLPFRGLLGAAVALLLYDWSHRLTNVTLFGDVYALVALVATAAIAVALFRSGRLIEKHDFWLDEAQISGIKRFGGRPIRGL
jgi:hypothetical protein